MAGFIHPKTTQLRARLGAGIFWGTIVVVLLFVVGFGIPKLSRSHGKSSKAGGEQEVNLKPGQRRFVINDESGSMTVTLPDNGAKQSQRQASLDREAASKPHMLEGGKIDAEPGKWSKLYPCVSEEHPGWCAFYDFKFDITSGPVEVYTYMSQGGQPTTTEPCVYVPGTDPVFPSGKFISFRAFQPKTKDQRVCGGYWYEKKEVAGKILEANATEIKSDK